MVTPACNETQAPGADRCKKLLVEVDVGRRFAEICWEKLITPASHRAAALRLIERGYSRRRACGLTEVDLRTVRCAPDPGDAMIRERLHRFAAERCRFGYRQLGSCWNVRVFELCQCRFEAKPDDPARHSLADWLVALRGA